MRRFLAIVVVIAAAAWASELKVGFVTGLGIQSFTGTLGGKYSVQCPNIDAGVGQRVFVRTGCKTRPDGGVTCVVDAGLGDTMVDFTANQDPYQIDLAPAEDRIHIKNADGNSIWCNIYRRAP